MKPLFVHEWREEAQDRQVPLSQLGQDDQIDGIGKSIIDFAQPMPVKVAAEGVETQAKA